MLLDGGLIDTQYLKHFLIGKLECGDHVRSLKTPVLRLFLCLLLY